MYLLFMTALQPAIAPPCKTGVGELVPTAVVAREVAEPIIRNRFGWEPPFTEARDHGLEITVEPDLADAGKWQVGLFPPAKLKADGSTVIAFGGSGLWFKIDRSDGQITEVRTFSR